MWNEEQEAVIESPSRAKQVIAGAGSGKTTTMIGLLSANESKAKIDPKRTLIVTFTNKATDEFKTRLLKNKLSESYRISTFHAFCYQIIQEYHPIYLNQSIGILDPKDKELFTIDYLYKDRFQIGGIPFAILFQKNAEMFKLEYPEIYSRYITALESWKHQNKKLEFEDLPEILYKGLKEDQDWTRKINSLFDSVIVDEFQDTDKTQLKILQYLKPPNITIVGDDWQAIYGFRGATPEPFLNFPEYFPETQRFLLSTNYRSLKGIIDLSAHALKKNQSKIPKEVRSVRAGETSFHKIILDHPKADRFSAVVKINSLIQENSDTIMLVRSNFRKREWIQAGVNETNVMTIHAAKGLEFNTVVLDLSSGWNLPEACDQAQIEEERRILYVAISRAKDQIILIGRKKQKMKIGLEDEFFEYFRNFDSFAKPTLRYRLLW